MVAVVARARTSISLGLQARHWDATSAKLVATLSEDEVAVHCLAFSPNGTVLAAGNANGTVDLWDIETREKLGTIQVHSKTVNDVAFSPNGTLLATGVWGEGPVKLWDVASRQLRRVLSGHTSSINSIAFSPDGKTIASASSDTTVKLWEVENGRLIRSLANPDKMFAVAFSRDGKRLAAAGNFQSVRIWDLAPQEVIHDFLAHWRQVSALVFTPDDKMLVTSGFDNSTRFWSLASLPGLFPTEFVGAQPYATFKVHKDWSMCAAFSRTPGDLLAAAAFLPCVGVWNLKDSAYVAAFDLKKGEDGADWITGNSLLFTRNSGTLLTCSSRKTQPQVGLRETKQFRLRATIEPGPNSEGTGLWWSTMALSPDEKALLVASKHQSLVTMTNTKMRLPIWSVASVHGGPLSAAISPDGQMAAMGTDLGYVMLLDAATGEARHEPLQHGEEWVTAAVFSPKGKLLASVGHDSVVKLWDLQSYESVTLPKAHNEKTNSAAFSPDGNLLVTTGGVSVPDKSPWDHQGEVCLWDVATKKLLKKFTAHHGSVTCGVFSPDGKSLATTGRDGKMYLWDVAELLQSGQQVADESQPDQP